MKDYNRFFSGVLCTALLVCGCGGSSYEEYVSDVQYTGISFSAGSGCYPEEFELSITGTGVDSIWYTTDGSTPVPGSSKLYEAPITITDRKSDANVASAVDPKYFDMNSGHTYYDSATQSVKNKYGPPKKDEVDKCTVIRAVGCDSDGNTTETITNTYFIGDISSHIEGINEAALSFGKSIYIISITADHDDLFDYERGIYVGGRVFSDSLVELGLNRYDLEALRKYPANYNQKGKEWERYSHVDFLESDGVTTNLVYSQDCGLRIEGNYSRSDLQKSFRIYARKEYGNDHFSYPFFEDAKNDKGETIDYYKKITFRAGGNCALVLKYNDAFWEGLLHDTNIETMYSRPAVIYLNGEYWGVYIMQQDYCGALLEEKYGVRDDSVIIYKGDAEKCLRLGYMLDDGGLPDGETEETSYYFRELIDFLNSHESAASDEDYETLTKIVDPDSVADYFAAEIWMNNKWDWPGKNWLLWKADRIADFSHPLARSMADNRWRFMLCDMDFGGWSKSEINVNTIKEDNYKQYGLLDRATTNIPVRIFFYLMTNKAFRENFYNRLRQLDITAFDDYTAVKFLDRIHGSYYPLLHQFYVRYYGRKEADDIYDSLPYWGSGYEELKGYIEGRSDYIENMITWAEDTMTEQGY